MCQLRAGFSVAAKRDFSATGTDAAEEAVPRPGEIGEVSGIPDDQLHRKVKTASAKRHMCAPASYAA
jgi:hypothetical protein